MNETAKVYDLDERTYKFALKVRLLLRGRDWHRLSWDDVSQLLRSSGSVAANYIEANENLSTADFVYRIKICRKESKESGLWLRLLADTNELPEDFLKTLRDLYRESSELVRIFNSIARNKVSNSSQD